MSREDEVYLSNGGFLPLALPRRPRGPLRDQLGGLRLLGVGVALVVFGGLCALNNRCQRRLRC